MFLSMVVGEGGMEATGGGGVGVMCLPDEVSLRALPSKLPFPADIAAFSFLCSQPPPQT